MAANSKTVTAPDTISPKVYWPLVVGVALTFIATFLAAVTPDMLTALGAFAVPMALALGAVAQNLTGYLKSDRLRVIGVEATAAILPDAPVTSQVVPEFVELADEDDTAGDLAAEVAQLNTREG